MRAPGTAFLPVLATLIWKDLLLDWRRLEDSLAVACLAVLVLLLFAFSVGGGEGNDAYQITPATLNALQEAELPPEALLALTRLQGRMYREREEFLLALTQQPALPVAWRAELLQRARRHPQQETLAGLLWACLLLAGALGMQRAFARESEHGCLEGLLLAPISRVWIYLAKVCTHWMQLILLGVVITPLFGLFFGLPLGGSWPVLLILWIGGGLGFSALGTLLATLTHTVPGREILLPILLYPLLVPLLLVGLHATSGALDQLPWSANGPWLLLLLAFDGLFLIVSCLVFEYVVET